MAQALGLRKLQDYLHGGCGLSSSPAWVLGVRYANPCPAKADDSKSPTNHKASEAEPASNASPSRRSDEKELLHDVVSRIWFTYRWEFRQIGGTGLTSDIGWGCTLRSGQMLVAQTLLHQSLGRGWRWNFDHGLPSSLQSLLALFWDDPSPSYPLSLHNICEAGRKHGLVAGHWLGPWALCNVLGELINRARPMGLRVWVLTGPGGGGAPFVDTAKLEELCSGFDEIPAQPAISADLDGSPSDPSVVSLPDCGRHRGGSGMLARHSATTSGHPGVSGDWELSSMPSDLEGKLCGFSGGLLVLVPLVLGVDKVNPLYFPQLKRVLQWPQSVGIVGGRPSSSLYFFGYQDDNVFYLDPHEAQRIANSPGEPGTYQCKALRHMPLKSIDPSLAIGFFCGSREELTDLVCRLKEMEMDSPSAPLVTVLSSDKVVCQGTVLQTQASEEGDDWQVL